MDYAEPQFEYDWYEKAMLPSLVKIKLRGGYTLCHMLYIRFVFPQLSVLNKSIKVSNLSLTKGGGR